MRSLLGVAPVALALQLACSPAAPGDTTDAATSTSGAASTAPAPTSSGASTDTGETPTTVGSGTGDTSTGTTSDDTTADATTDAGATTGAASTTTTNGETTGETGSTAADETTAALEPITRAWWVDGLDLQIRVIEEDTAAGLCRGVILEREGVVLDKYAAVTTPPAWGVRYIFVHAGPGACLDPYDWSQNEPAYAADASGTAVFHDLDGEGKPATLDIDVAATYMPGEPWTPLTDTLTASAVPVDVG